MRKTKEEFLKDLREFGWDWTIGLSDLCSLAGVENVQSVFMTNQVFVLLADDLMVAEMEQTPLFANRYNVHTGKAQWGNIAKAEAQWRADDHERITMALRRMSEGKSKLPQEA